MMATERARDDREASARVPTTGDAGAAPSRPVALVIDDEAAVRKTIAKALAKEGIEVDGAATAGEALAYLGATMPDLLLIDVMLPNGNGLELCRRIKQDPLLGSIPVIMVSALASPADVRAGLAAGAGDYIKKPFDADELCCRAWIQLHLRDTIRQERQAAQRLATIVDAAKDAIILLDAEGNIASWSRAATEIFGCSAAEVVGRSMQVLLSPTHFGAVQAAAVARFRANANAVGAGRTVALCGLHKDGHEVPLELSLCSTRLDGAWCSVCVVRDLSERRRSEELYRALFESSRDAILTLKPPGWAFGTANAAALAMFGARVEEELTAIGPGQLSPTLQADGRPSSEAIREMIEAAMREGTLFFEWSQQRLDGEVFPATVLLTRVELAGEQFLQATVRDITREKRLEQRLRASESRLRAVLEHLPVGVAIVGRDKIVRFANQAVVEMAGRDDVGEVIGTFCYETICRAACDECPVYDQGRKVDRVERSMPRADGSTLSVLKTVREVEFDGESVLLEAFVDISDRKTLELQLAHARKLEAVGQLAAGVAHEINTPTQYVGDSVNFVREAFVGLQQVLASYRRAMAGVAAGGDAAQLSAEVGAIEQEADLAYIEENLPACFERSLEGVGRIAAIVRAMKEFAHPDQREKSPADLNQAIAGTLVIAKNEYKYVADVTTELGDLPPVMCHLGAINQVFLNLIVNAAHAIGEVVKGTENRGLIVITTRCLEGRVQIDVADNGGGIPEAVRDRVFEPFFTTKAVGVGSGQGLAIARSIIVDKHQGALTFTTEEGKGTTFTIELPIDGGRKGNGGGAP